MKTGWLCGTIRDDGRKLRVQRERGNTVRHDEDRHPKSMKILLGPQMAADERGLKHKESRAKINFWGIFRVEAAETEHRGHEVTGVRETHTRGESRRSVAPPRRAMAGVRRYKPHVLLSHACKA